MEDEDMDDGGLLSQMKRRTRRQYDERKDMDDLDGVEDVRRTAFYPPLFSNLEICIGNTFRTT